MKRALVLGAGIQGVCVVLALRQRGYQVILVDRMPDVMLRTSLYNEGKIHLGFVYANDSTFRTADLLLRAALKFSPLLEGWLELKVAWREMVSTPFWYAIARDSMLAPKQLVAHFERVQSAFDERVGAGESANYLGTDLRGKNLWRPAPRARDTWFASKHVVESVETVELALNNKRFRELVSARLRTFPEITPRFGTRVESIARNARGFCVSGSRSDGARWSEESDVVVNCLWDGRLTLDRQLGILPHRAFVMRLKYRLLGKLAPTLNGLPSFTMVLGRFGDVVHYPNAPSYFSWYPACLRGWSRELTPPPEWDAVCRGDTTSELASRVARETLDAFEGIIPGIGTSWIESVDAGIIYAWGETDIDDYASGLHQRYETGFTAHDGYYSVNTGKFTCAPLFAEQLAQHLDG